MIIKNEVERLVEKKQILHLKKEKLNNRHNANESSYENRISKLRDRKYKEKQSYEAKLKNLDRKISKIEKFITAEKAFISGIDKD